jgi:hypothetical protein
MTPFAVVIVTQGRERLPFLHCTLGALTCVLKNTEVHVVVNDGGRDDETFDPLIPILDSTFAMRGNRFFIQHCPKEWSVGMAKAGYFTGLATRFEWILGLDDDVLLSAESLQRLNYAVSGCKDIHIFTFPVFDVNNSRQYPDWSLRVRPSREFLKLRGQELAAACFSLWQPGPYLMMGVYKEPRYSIARSLMHLPTMIQSGALEFWRTYPKGVRGHDLAVARVLHQHGARAVLVFGAVAYHIGLTTPHLDGDTWKSDPEFPELEKKP